MILENFLKQILDEIEKECNISDFNIDIIVEENKDRPLAAKIFDNQIVWSDYNFEFIHQSIYQMLKDNNIYIDYSSKYLYFVTKCCLCHEVGHFLDEYSMDSMYRLYKISDKSSKCTNIQEYNILALEYKNIKVSMEIKAWDICEKIMNIKDSFENKIFNLIKSYFLQTYFNINKTIVA